MNSPRIYLHVNFTPELSLSKINIKTAENRALKNISPTSLFSDKLVF